MFLVLLTIVLTHPSPASAQSEAIHLWITPSSSIINVTNLAPGDSITAPLSISEVGGDISDVSIKARMQSGSEPFYKQLQFVVSKKNKVIFKGPLSSFQKFKVKDVNKGDSTFLFTIKFPLSAGNEFQSAQTIIAFDFIGVYSGLTVSDNKLPKTSTNSFNLISVGLIIILSGTSILFYQRQKRDSL